MAKALLLWERETNSRVPRTTPAATRRLPLPRPLMAGERPWRRVPQTITKAVLMYILFCYDIVENNRRTRLFKRLGGLLTHVQYSVFEGEVGPHQREELESLTLRTIDGETDQVRIFTLCKSCRASIRLLGCSTPVGNPEDPIIV